MHRLLPFVFAPFLMGQSCGLSVERQRGEPCTRDRDCDEESGLACIGGVCGSAAVDAGPDGAVDAS